MLAVWLAARSVPSSTTIGFGQSWTDDLHGMARGGRETSGGQQDVLEASLGGDGDVGVHLAGDECGAVYRVQHLDDDLGMCVEASGLEPVCDQRLSFADRQPFEVDASDEAAA